MVAKITDMHAVRWVNSYVSGKEARLVRRAIANEERAVIARLNRALNEVALGCGRQIDRDSGRQWRTVAREAEAELATLRSVVARCFGETQPFVVEEDRGG